MKLVQEGMNMRILCSRHVDPARHVVLANITHAAECQRCCEMSLQDRHEEMLEAEEQLRDKLDGFLRRFAHAVPCGA